ncbi:MAG TPA: His/Gly/Thr/Pro-type tRNA ligase C-terminal domain-containing protein [Flavobacteriales bacterium]|nr:His/Gly/Thr/Pro-type tRNA ligase C-terminal domain-containing protein [Flavobacteriales bacterium]
MDHETLTDDAVTIRERDSMRQERVKISELERIVGEKVDLRGLLRKL